MYSVVFVDDEPWSAIDAMNSVDWKKHNLSVAAYLSSPEKALDELCRLSPDLVIVDIRMPEMDGFEFIEACLRREARCLFVILSGYSDFEYARRALRLPVEDYWLKPLDPVLVDGSLGKIRRKLDDAASVEPDADPHFHALLSYVREHAEGKLLLEDVAAAFNYNRNYLCTLFKRHTGQTFVQYLTDVRMRQACRMLAQTDQGLDAIARQCGLGDAVYFNKVFRKHTGATPAAYRRRARGGAS